MSPLKIGTVLLWLLCAASFLMPDAWGAAAWGRTLFWGLLAVHAIECVIFLRVLRSAPGPLASQLLQTLIFGIIHIRGLQNAAAPPVRSS